MSKSFKNRTRAGSVSIVFLLVLAMVLAACGPAATPMPTYTPLPTYTPPPAPTAAPTQAAGAQCSGEPIIMSFTANPATIQPGETAVLEWGLVRNAQAAVLVTPEGRLGVATPGQSQVQPNRTTTYSLHAICGNTVVQQQVTVQVEVPGGCSGTPHIASFTANPATIQPGETTTLEWGPVENASAAVLVSPEGKKGVGTPGKRVIEPNQTTTYALVAYCGSEIVQKNVQVNVEGTVTCSGTPIISSFGANPETIKKGETSTLKWGLVANSSGAYLTDGEEIIGIATPGQHDVKPDQTTTYTLAAFCAGNIVLSDVIVKVE